MDAKIKELLTRLSFFAEDGMADKPIVEIAKQADALLLEVARKQNTQQPVAWISDRGLPEFVAGAPKLPTGTQLYTAPPVPRDVLMALAEEVQAAVKNAARAEYSDHTCEDEVAYDPINIAAIADRYASKVQPEPVNQLLLAEAVALLEGHQKWINKLPVPTAGATHQMMHVVGKAIDILKGVVVEKASISPLQEGEINDEWRAHGGKVTGNGTCFVIGKWDYHKLRRNIAAAEAAQPVVPVADGWPTVNPRRPYYDDDPDGYLESDRDFIENNREAVVWFLENAEELRTMQPASAQPLSDAELGDLIVSIADSNGFDTKDPAGVDELCRAVARAIEARPASAQPVAVPDERAEFEFAYAQKWQSSSSNAAQYSIAYLCNELKEMRNGDEYGEGQDYLNFLWEGWQDRAMMSAAQQPEGV